MRRQQRPDTHQRLFQYCRGSPCRDRWSARRGPQACFILCQRLRQHQATAFPRLFAREQKVLHVADNMFGLPVATTVSPRPPVSASLTVTLGSRLSRRRSSAAIARLDRGELSRYPEAHAGQNMNVVLPLPFGPTMPTAVAALQWPNFEKSREWDGHHSFCRYCELSISMHQTAPRNSG